MSRSEQTDVLSSAQKAPHGEEQADSQAFSAPLQGDEEVREDVTSQEDDLVPALPASFEAMSQGDEAEAGTKEDDAQADKPVGAPPLEDVIEAISTVYDPEIPVNVYELGLIYAIDLHDDGEVEVEMSLTAPNCPSAQELPQMIRHAILNVPSVKKAEVRVVWDPPWDMSRMSDTARLALNMF